MAKADDNITLKLSLDEDASRWLESLVSSLRPRGRKSPDQKLETFCQALDKRPGLADEVRASAWSYLETHSIRGLICEAGINWGHNLFDSLGSRLLGKLLPPPPQTDSLQHSVRQAFDRKLDDQWLASYSDASLERLSQIFRIPRDHPMLQKCRVELLTGLEILSHRLAAMGLEPELVSNAPELEKYANPFLAQSHEVAELLKILQEGIPPKSESPVNHDDHLNVLLTQCTEIIHKVQRQVKTRGTSLHLTYQMATIERVIERIQVVAALATGRLTHVEMWRFFLSLCIAENRRHSLSDLVRQHSRAIALQIVRQAGHRGGHYIAQSHQQLRKLFLAALGGGLVVAFIAMFKIHIAANSPPPLLLTIGYSFNYALGFIILHLLGFTLATKQPAMTAAALAASMPDQNQKIRNASLEGVAKLCILTARSQFAAILGNVILAFPTAYLISWVWQQKFGVSLASPVKAEHLMSELFGLWPILYAAVAGVGLFLSGIVSGYVDNLSAYYSIPERVRHSPALTTMLGKRVNVWARLAENEAGAIAGNAALGIYLGVMSGLGPTLGIPLDIRHVTFSAANLGYAVQAQGLSWDTFLPAALGVTLIGLTNLLVSFSLALWTAANARSIPKRNLFRMLRTLLRHVKDNAEEGISSVSISVLADATRKSTPARDHASTHP
jgi:site-specific recombinase